METFNTKGHDMIEWKFKEIIADLFLEFVNFCNLFIMSLFLFLLGCNLIINLLFNFFDFGCESVI